MSQEDHDLLIRIEGKLDTALKDIKEQGDKIKFHDKVIYGFGGIILFLQFVAPFFHK